MRWIDPTYQGGEEKKAPALQVEHLTVSYDRSPALWDISLEVPQGKLVGIIGRNGAGKSTLVKAAVGLAKKLSGRIELCGMDLKSARKQIAYVPQRGTVDWDFPITVHELALMGRYGKLGLFRRPREADRAAADHSLALVGMSEFRDRQISQLSGGQQQRAFLARALVQEAAIYFLDEPFAGVDHATETVIIQLLREARSRGATVFVVHHDLSTVEHYFDWTIMLNLRLVACGKTEEVFTTENLNSTFGKSYALLDEALRLAKQKQAGLGKGLR